ncbi:MAG: hypothetical protein JWN70_6824 [Planctomycetaceae bacterium]|nr:hypothetical protein [Planctomycetaceae bacterium]
MGQFRVMLRQPYSFAASFNSLPLISDAVSVFAVLIMWNVLDQKFVRRSIPEYSPATCSS